MLNKNIVKMRKERGLTQVELAKLLHVTQSAVSHWESGRSIPDTVQLFQIAEFFGVSIDAIKGETIQSTHTQEIETVSVSTSQENAPADMRAEAKQLLEAMNDEQYQAALQYLKFLKTQK